MHYLVNDPLASTEKKDSYVALAFRTAAQFEDPRMHLLHAMQGMANELLEIHEGYEAEYEDGEYFVKEAGDFLWFLSLNCMYFAGFDVQKADALLHDAIVSAPPRQEQRANELAILANLFVSMVKKEIFYGKQQKTGDIHKVILSSITEVFGVLKQVSEQVSDYVSVEEVMEKNIAKLCARYPKGHFEQLSAINRDEAAEDAAVRGVQ